MICFIHFYIFINVNHCFFYRARSFFMESCGPGTKILVPILTFVHDGRGTSANVLLHPYLHDARSSSFTYSKQYLFYFTGDLASFWTTSLPFAVPHLQSLTTGLCLFPQQSSLVRFSIFDFLFLLPVYSFQSVV